jgi:hypothetical protein
MTSAYEDSERAWAEQARRAFHHYVDNESDVTDPPIHEQRAKKLDTLQYFFTHNLVEDPIDGTPFDCAVLDALAALRKQFCS